MPLLNHFAYPLDPHRPWTGFHSAWANAISAGLNRSLPPGYFSGPEVQWRHEGDAIVVRESAATAPGPNLWPGDGGTATLAPPREPQKTLPFEPGDDTCEVRILNEEGAEQTLVGVVEIVSPGNKERPANRKAFLGKVLGYLNAGVGVCVLDIVTNRPRSLHRELLQDLGDPDPEADATYAATYARADGGEARVRVWYEPLTVDGELPDVVLPLKSGPAIELPLAASYAEACANYRIDPAAVRAATE